MTIIRVDPPKLRQAGRAFKEIAATARRLAHDALRATERVPSYEGEFGPRVRSGGAEVYAEHVVLARLAEEAADFLLRKADEFEAVDEAGQAALASLGMQLHQWSQAFETLLGTGSPATPASYESRELSLEDFEAMTEDERIAWVRALNQQRGNS